MKDDNELIQKRLQNMKEFYDKAFNLVDNLPNSVPLEVKNMIKDALGDKELKSVMDGIESQRPPRLFLIGRTGVGKSSLINAISGSYLARVSDTTSCTPTIQVHDYKRAGKILFQALDTRGIAETAPIDEELSAEDLLINQVKAFTPDVALFLLNCTHRDDVLSDIQFLKKVSQTYLELNKTHLPIVVIINKSDEMAPSRIKDPKNYPISKITKINEMVSFYQQIIEKNQLQIDGILAVSSLIEWMTENDEEISVEEIEKLTPAEIENLKISYDGRYQIDSLLDLLLDSIQDYDAKMGLSMIARLEEFVDRLANKLIGVFSTVSATVALTPIPFSDIYILLVLQAVLVALIASLSGREISLEAAKEFILSLGGVVGMGFAFRALAQQGIKLVNYIFPAAGSIISAGVAFGGTQAIGNAAKAYFIHDKSLKEVKNLLKKNTPDNPSLPPAGEGNNQ